MAKMIAPGDDGQRKQDASEYNGYDQYFFHVRLNLGFIIVFLTSRANCASLLEMVIGLSDYPDQ